MAAAADFRTAYTSALWAYLADSDERARRSAYELGREAVTAGLGMMDVADAHNDAVLVALGGGAAPEPATRAAGDFLLETLAAFEMVQRGVGEARAAADRERRHAAILRQLSNFLADASLALSARESTHEILHLVAEQTHELIGGACCVATVVSEGDAPAARAASFSEADAILGARLALGDLSALEQLVAPLAPVARMDPMPVLAGSMPGFDDGGRCVRSWLGAPLTTLDGRRIGFVHLFDERPSAFASEDEGVLRHLAQMGSAAVERVGLYAGGTVTAREDETTSAR
jgi:GAF domain-containing protein